MLYILAIDPPLKHAKFYLGYCQDGRLKARLAEHESGYGAALTRAAINSGRELRLVATLPKATRRDERILKNRKNTPRLVNQITKKNSNWRLE